jgi:hypothetical protein
MLTDKYLADSGDKNSIHRLLQISQNPEAEVETNNQFTTLFKPT